MKQRIKYTTVNNDIFNISAIGCIINTTVNINGSILPVKFNTVIFHTIPKREETWRNYSLYSYMPVSCIINGNEAVDVLCMSVSISEHIANNIGFTRDTEKELYNGVANSFGLVEYYTPVIDTRYIHTEVFHELIGSVKVTVAHYTCPMNKTAIGEIRTEYYGAYINGQSILEYSLHDLGKELDEYFEDFSNRLIVNEPREIREKELTSIINKVLHDRYKPVV